MAHAFFEVFQMLSTATFETPFSWIAFFLSARYPLLDLQHEKKILLIGKTAWENKTRWSSCILPPLYE